MEKLDLKKLIFSGIFIIACILLAVFGQISHAINLLQSSGIDRNTLFLLLITPFIALFISFCRIMIGINVPTILIPTILIFSLFTIGLNTTIIFLCLSIALALLGKYLIAEFHLHFSTKISLIFSFVSIGLILALPLLKDTLSLTAAAIYPILVISFINEKQFSFKISKNSLINDFKSILKVIAFSILCFFLLGGVLYGFQFPEIKQLILAYPESILLALMINFIIGQYTGLRATEVIRFRKLIFKSK
jgi:hypothetical protein